MNLTDFFKLVAHFLGIIGDGGNSTTGLTTVGYFNTTLTTPIIFDSTTFTKHPSDTSSKLLTALIDGNSPKSETPVTGITAESLIDVSSTTVDSNFTSTVTEESEETANVTTVTSSTSETTTNSSKTSSTTQSTSETTSETTVSAETTTSNVSSSSSETTPSVSSETTSTATNQSSSVTTASSETSGSVTSQSSSVTTTSAETTVSPTEKPGLSRGAVAGIVIGCLLLVAIITAAVVFFVKNKGSPETQRLTV